MPIAICPNCAHNFSFDPDRVAFAPSVSIIRLPFSAYTTYFTQCPQCGRWVTTQIDDGPERKESPGQRVTSHS